MTTSQNRGPGSPTYGQQTSADIPVGDESGDTPEMKERASQAAGTAKEEGAHVAETAKGEAQQVVGEAKAKAADLVNETKSQVDQQSRNQMQALATKLDELRREIDSMVDGSDIQGTVTELARQLSDKTRTLSSQLAERDPKDMLEDVRSFARRRPGTFLAGATVAGVVAGRLTRGAKRAHDDSDTSTAMPMTEPVTTTQTVPAATRRSATGQPAGAGGATTAAPAAQPTGGVL
jgi:DNA polymerase II small subunit/DNA polymerase delta subunit B